jgi:hypothetical protein
LASRHRLVPHFDHEDLLRNATLQAPIAGFARGTNDLFQG